MPWQQTPYTVPMLVSAVVTGGFTLVTVVYGRRTGMTRRLAAFAALMGAATIWAVTYALSLSSTTVDAKLFWLGVASAVTTVVPTALLVFALYTTGRDHWLTARTWAMLAIEPVVVSVVSVVSPIGVLWQDVALDTTRGFALLQRDLGPLFYVHAGYSYLLVTTSLVLFLLLARGNSDLYRGQVAALVVGSLFPLASNIVFALELGPPVNLTPVAASPLGVCYAFAIFRYKLLEIVPVARDTVVEEMRDGYLVLDTEDNVVDLNPAARRILDVSDVVGRPFSAVLPDVAASIDDPGTTPTELVVGDDDPQYLEVQVTPLDRDPGGRVVTLRDVTDRRQVERRFQSLIENSRDLITVFDESGEITYQSPASRRVLGYDPTEMVGHTIAEFVHPEDAARMRDRFDQTVEAGDTERFEYRIRHDDGSWRVHESLTTNLLDEPAVEGIVANARDVTARKEREEELHRTNERLDEFAELVSHDLRNPLTVAHSNVELGRETGEDERFESALTALERMETIIDDVLMLARQGHAVTDPRQVSLETVARQAWETVHTDGLELEVAGDCRFEADPHRVQELFENCYRNAMEHAVPADSATGTVTVTVRPLGADAIAQSDGGELGPDPDEPVGFAVEDDGPGIPASEQDEVFESGYTTSEDGTGFGLAIVAQIAEAHGWTVEACDGPDGGAQLRVTGLTGARP